MLANSIFCEHKDDQLSDVKEDGFTNLFSEDCNQPVTNFVSGDFKKDFNMPIYDEYEDEKLGCCTQKTSYKFCKFKAYE